MDSLALPAWVAAATAVYGAWQYIDTRRREEHRLRFEQFMRVFDQASGRVGSSGTVDVQQLAAIYMLPVYTEYRSVWLPVLDYWELRLHSDLKDKSSTPDFLAAISSVRS